MESPRLPIILELGGKCNLCGWRKVPELLHISRRDKQPEKTGGGSAWYKRLIHIQQHPMEYRLLCLNCEGIEKLEWNKKVNTPPKQDIVVWNASKLPRSAAENPPASIFGQYEAYDCWVVHGDDAWRWKKPKELFTSRSFADDFGVEQFLEGISVFK